MKIYYMGERIDTYKRDKKGRFAGISRVVESAQQSRLFSYSLTFLIGTGFGIVLMLIQVVRTFG